MRCLTAFLAAEPGTRSSSLQTPIILTPSTSNEPQLLTGFWLLELGSCQVLLLSLFRIWRRRAEWKQVVQVVPPPHAQLAQGFAVRTFRI